MDAKQLLEEYHKLNEVEKMKFQRGINIDVKTQEDKVREMRKNVFDKMMDIKKNDGTPYFDPELLKKNLKM